MIKEIQILHPYQSNSYIKQRQSRQSGCRRVQEKSRKPSEKWMWRVKEMIFKDDKRRKTNFTFDAFQHGKTSFIRRKTNGTKDDYNIAGIFYCETKLQENNSMIKTDKIDCLKYPEKCSTQKSTCRWQISKNHSNSKNYVWEEKKIHKSSAIKILSKEKFNKKTCEKHIHINTSKKG